MTAPTSDERREVAEKLRHASHTDANLDVTIAIAILDTIGEVHRPIAAVVADLIDPTCKMAVKNGHACCGRCGHRLADEWEVEEDLYEFRPYCPDCGCRVVGQR